MEATIVNLDLLISAIIHDLGKVSLEYFLSKENNSYIPDMHAHILLDKYPYIRSILEKSTLWAPDITYLDIMTKHHDSYVTGTLKIFKEADRQDHIKNFSFPPPVQTRTPVKDHMIQMNFFGKTIKCSISEIPHMQKLLAKNLKILINGYMKDKVEVINKIYKPILSYCPTDNRPAYSVSIWDHSISLYMYLLNIRNIKHPLQEYSHPECSLFHPYGNINLWKQVYPYYEALFQASAYSLVKNLEDIQKRTEKHISHLPHNGELHRLLFMKRNINYLKAMAKKHDPKYIEYIFRRILGLSKPPSISNIAYRTIRSYLNLVYNHNYTHTGALFHMFFVRKVSLTDILQIQRIGTNGPLQPLLGTPNSKTCIYKGKFHNPFPWIYTTKDKGTAIKKNLYITSRNHNILVNQSEIFLKRIGPKRYRFTTNC
ncbi:hypothetical protein GM182_02255 [bacterium 3DAC]|nr:hypothetical protein GM182_02255 [bacterium 3DAC]